MISEEKYKLKMAVISGASHAIKFKERKPRATESEVLQHITDQIDEILKKIDEQEEE